LTLASLSSIIQSHILKVNGAQWFLKTSTSPACRNSTAFCWSCYHHVVLCHLCSLTWVLTATYPTQSHHTPLLWYCKNKTNNPPKLLRVPFCMNILWARLDLSSSVSPGWGPMRQPIAHCVSHPDRSCGFLFLLQCLPCCSLLMSTGQDEPPGVLIPQAGALWPFGASSF
jgi:hypothetical protein